MPTLQAQPREKSSSAAVNRLRKEGQMPLALLSKDGTTRMLQADRVELRELINGIEGLNIFEVDADGSTTKVILKSVQRDPVSRQVIHVTVQEIKDTDVIKVNIPVRVEGTPLAVTKRSATLMLPMSEIEVQAKVSDLPNEIVIDVSKMSQNDRIIVGDLKAYANVTFTANEEAVLATTKQLRGMADLDEGTSEGEEGAEGESADAETETSEEASE